MPPQVDLRWDSGPVLAVIKDGRPTDEPCRLTPVEVALLVKRLAAYLVAWHRPDVDLAVQDRHTDPAWQTSTNTEGDHDE